MQLANDGDLSIKYGDFTSKHWDLTIQETGDLSKKHLTLGYPSAINIYMIYMAGSS